MSQRTPDPALTKTPMERIFEKVMNRKMTAKEREILQLNVGVGDVAGKHGNGNASIQKSEAKEKVKRAPDAKRALSATAGVR